MESLVNYTEEQLKQRLSVTVDLLIKNKTPVVQSVAFLLGGQAGAGKTSLQTMIDEKMKGNIIIINNDAFKPLHPNYKRLAKKYGKEVTKLVTPFSSRMTEELIDELSKRRYNLVIEGTLRTIDTPKATAKFLQKRGYKTNLYVIAVPKQLSYVGTLTRFEDMFQLNPLAARETPKSIHDEMIDKLPLNLDELFENKIFAEIHVFTRAKEHMYSSLTQIKSPRAVLESKLHEVVESTRLDAYIARLFLKMQENGHDIDGIKETILRHLKEYEAIKQ